MDPLTLSLIGGGGLGLLKGLFIDGPQAARQNKVNAETARYSPWTGMKADTTKQNPNIFGDVLTGVGLGGMLGQSGLLQGNPMQGPGPWASGYKMPSSPWQGMLGMGN